MVMYSHFFIMVHLNIVVRPFWCSRGVSILHITHEKQRQPTKKTVYTTLSASIIEFCLPMLRSYALAMANRIKSLGERSRVKVNSCFLNKPCYHISLIWPGYSVGYVSTFIYTKISVMILNNLETQFNTSVIKVYFHLDVYICPP